MMCDSLVRSRSSPSLVCVNQLVTYCAAFTQNGVTNNRFGKRTRSRNTRNSYISSFIGISKKVQRRGINRRIKLIFRNANTSSFFRMLRINTIWYFINGNNCAWICIFNTMHVVRHIVHGWPLTVTVYSRAVFKGCNMVIT